MDIEIVDSRGISLGTGYLVIRAAQMAGALLLTASRWASAPDSDEVNTEE